MAAEGIDGDEWSKQVRDEWCKQLKAMGFVHAPKKQMLEGLGNPWGKRPKP